MDTTVSHPGRTRPLVGLGLRELDVLVQSAGESRPYWADGILSSATGRSLYYAVARAASDRQVPRG